MHCIISQNKDIIAADKAFFSLLKSDDLAGLYRQIASGAIDIAFEKDSMIIANSDDICSYPIKSFEIDGLLSQNQIIEVLVKVPSDEIKINQNDASETFSTQEDNSLPDQEVEKIDIDAQTISQHMGLSKTDYISFLQEYVQTAKSLKEDLESNDEDKQRPAIKFIMHLSDMLYLPSYISNLIESLSSSISQENIDKFYDAIERISTNNEISEKSLDVTDHDQESLKPAEPCEDQKNHETECENLKSKSNRSIDLSDVVPEEFNFMLNDAANELSLPTDIIKEFIDDFIEQCHMQTNNLLEAYEKGEIEKVKKTAHLLKGVASNLYIAPLAQSLLELQHNEDIEQIESLIKKYWAQFISFENLMKNTRKEIL